MLTMKPIRLVWNTGISLMVSLLAFPGVAAADPALARTDVVCAASDTPRELVPLANYRCPAQDARKVLQTALDEASRLRVRCILLEGTYVINSRSERSRHGALCFRTVGEDGSGATNLCYMTLEGTVAPNSTDDGAIIRMGDELYASIDDKEEFSLLFCDGGGHPNLRGWCIRNLAAQLPGNRKPVVVFDGRYCGALRYESIRATACLPGTVDHGTAKGATVPHPKCVAFRGTCGSNVGATSTWRELGAYGFGIGFDIGGEHVYCESLSAWYSMWGFAFNCYQGKPSIDNALDGCRHGVEVYPVTCVNLLDEHSIHMPKFGDAGSYLKSEDQSPQIRIIGMNIQWPNVCPGYTDDIRLKPEFLVGRHRATETIPGYWRGRIEYVIDHTQPGCGVKLVHTPFFEKGSGENVICQNLLDKPAGTTRERLGYGSNRMQQFYDTDLRKMLFYDGTVWRDFNGAEAEGGFVTVRENVMPVRDQRDLWAVGGGNGSFAYTNGEARVSFKGDWICLYHRWSHPGPERMKGAAEYVLRTEPAFEGDVTLTLRREEKDHGTNVCVKVAAKWAEEMRFKTGLDAHDHYYLDRVDFRYKRTSEMRSFRFLGIDAVTRECPAAVLRADVETGNPFRLVRNGKNEKAVLVLRNPSDRKLDWNVHLKVEDFFGNCREKDFPVTLDAGGVLRRPMEEELPKGIRYVTVVAERGGQAATNRTTWALVDTHEVTPLQPEEEFRMGVNFHGLRYSQIDRAIGMDALVAVGAKMVRNEATIFPGIWRDEDKFDWAASDGYLDQLERHGLALDSIVWWPADWAVRKGEDGKPVKGAVRSGILRTFGEMLGRRYGKRIAWYEVGNEWDMTRPAWLPYEDAVRQVREFAEGVKSVCPTAKVIPCGFACDSSVRHPSRVIRPMFQEDLVRDVQDVVDAHAVHIHSNFKEFTDKLDFFLQWRKERGISLPWYANETAISTTAMRPNDRAAAVILWQKVLYAWSRGSVDYIWYNLRATGYNPSDSEQGYGIFTPDYHPRTAAAAFSAVAANFRHLKADGVLHDGRERQVMRFAGRRGGKDVRVIAGWDGFAGKPMPIRVRTDAKKAYLVDTMGNRREVAIKGGVACWSVGADPSALYLEDCRSAEPDATDLANEAKRPVQVIVPAEKANPILEFEKNRNLKTDILINSYDNVYEVFKAMPEHADRCWKWWGDLWVRVNFARTDGKVWMNINCWDDVHVPDFDHPLEGDAVVLRLGDWKVQLVGSAKRCEVKVLEKPKGASDPKDGWAKLTFKPGYEKNYFFEFDPAALGFGDEVPFNIRVYDNDGKGFDGWMEYAPLDETECPVLLKL